VRVRFAFKNRTVRISLSEYVSVHEVRRQLAHVRRLRIGSVERAYLESLEVLGVRIFRPAFLDWCVSTFKLAPVYVGEEDGLLCIESSGPWVEVTLWETIVLCIVNELYAREAVRRSGRAWEEVIQEADTRLSQKIALLSREVFGASLADFGTRRRAGGEWQMHVIRRMTNELPKGMFIGTSNVHFAMELGLRPIGTMAHELFMTAYALARAQGTPWSGIREGQTEIFQKWENFYGPALLIALPDTFGSEAFFRFLAPKNFPLAWQGVRHDSGDPALFGERVLRYYREAGVDPREKTLVFSDGLSADEIVRLHHMFIGRIALAFGWGTTLTFDIPDVTPLSIVMKVVEAEGHQAVKLSDNLAKAVGDEGEARYAARVFEYRSAFREMPIV